ncbi:alpha/beta fold hydrolase [Chelativorans sp. ZYF759]|uniref:alpha/beta fold hydrolase n=1 Tax=Chelativorans sp. ZYF759 TaxID=2692213 RepID=UPI00145D9C7C|nr:alpha/beta hydrolase [Chelativorans sp. ZYF759]NMG40129.1 alpha/beta fold hydrolase [Chelativorans sp. ZYF759]
MHLLLAAIGFIVALAAALFGVSRVGAHLIEARNPPVGQFATVADTRLHHVHVPASGEADLPPVVFIHGASGNLLDQMVPIRPLLEGRSEMLFVDRPGHGWSDRGGPANATPSGQAAAIAALMEAYGMEDAIVVGHSFGGAIAAAFALDHPEKTRGLVFLSAATHPWPGAGTSWYYEVAATPILGHLFAETLAWPGGALRMRQASACVFSPNPLSEGYLKDAAIELVLRPRSFRANAIDVAGLYDHVVEMAPRYGEIAAPTVVITGDHDTVVFEEIHSRGLARDIPGAELVWIENMGHKPDWTAPDLVLAAIEKVAGRDRDLQAVAAQIEARVSTDAHGPLDACPVERPTEGVSS